MMMEWGYSALPWLIGAVVRGLAFFGFVAAVLWLADRSMSGPGSRFDSAQQMSPPSLPAPTDPELILAQRFAAGEIDSEDFAQRRSLLRQRNADQSAT